MTFDRRKYNQKYMAKVRRKEKQKELLAQGKCPVCEMLLKSEWHEKCPYLGDVDR